MIYFLTLSSTGWSSEPNQTIFCVFFCFCPDIFTDISPHLVFKRCSGTHATLWPFDLPFPGGDDDGDDGETKASPLPPPHTAHNDKFDVQHKHKHTKKTHETNGYAYDDSNHDSAESRACFSIQGGAGAGLQYPAYFKDAKGNNHSVFGGNLGSLQYLKPGQKGMLPDVLQQGRNAGMPLYVRCPICQKEFKQKSTLLQHGCIHIESRPYVFYTSFIFAISSTIFRFLLLQKR